MSHIGLLFLFVLVLRLAQCNDMQFAIAPQHLGERIVSLDASSSSGFMITESA
jgi:hypothetical protein